VKEIKINIQQIKLKTNHYMNVVIARILTKRIHTNINEEKLFGASSMAQLAHLTSKHRALISKPQYHQNEF
jgi:hypothetical protein